MKPHLVGCYHRSLGSHPDDKSLEGKEIYSDNQKAKFVHSMLACGKSFEKIHDENKKNSNKPNSTSLFPRKYPLKKPSNPELGGWHGKIDNLVLCVGVGIYGGASNACLTRADGVFVWTE